MASEKTVDLEMMNESQFREHSERELKSRYLAAKRKHIAELAAVIAAPMLTRAMEAVDEDDGEEHARNVKRMVLAAAVNSARSIVAITEEQVKS